MPTVAHIFCVGDRNMIINATKYLTILVNQTFTAVTPSPILSTAPAASVPGV